MKEISRPLHLKVYAAAAKSECRLNPLTILFSSNTRLGHHWFALMLGTALPLCYTSLVGDAF